MNVIALVKTVTLGALGLTHVVSLGGRVVATPSKCEISKSATSAAAAA